MALEEVLVEIDPFAAYKERHGHDYTPEPVFGRCCICEKLIEVQTEPWEEYEPWAGGHAFPAHTLCLEKEELNSEG